MSDRVIYLYANCSSCRRAESLLHSSGLDYDRRDIFRDRLTPEEIRSLLARIDKSPVEVLSKRSIPYRELSLADRNVSEDELISLMSKHPGLLRRPILIAGDEVLIGFNQKHVEDLISRAGAN